MSQCDLPNWLGITSGSVSSISVWSPSSCGLGRVRAVERSVSLPMDMTSAWPLGEVLVVPPSMATSLKLPQSTAFRLSQLIGSRLWCDCSRCPCPPCPWPFACWPGCSGSSWQSAGMANCVCFTALRLLSLRLQFKWGRIRRGGQVPIKTSLNVPIRESPVYGSQYDAEYGKEQSAKERQPRQKGRQWHGETGCVACKV